MAKNIVLIGPMGVGKTTIGKKVAKALGKQFIDTDLVIQRDHGPIADIFERLGESEFRNYETAALVESLAQDAVIATGGGIVLRPENRKLLEQHWVVYLSTDGKHMASRLKNGNRPLLKNGMSDWKAIYEERKPLYQSLANFEIATNSKTVNQCVQEIKEMIGAE
jgi:shikimate kinase